MKHLFSGFHVEGCALHRVDVEKVGKHYSTLPCSYSDPHKQPRSFLSRNFSAVCLHRISVFQTERSPLSIAMEAPPLPYLLREGFLFRKRISSDTVYFYGTHPREIQKTLNECFSLGIDPDIIVPSPIALWRWAQEHHQWEEGLLFYIGSSFFLAVLVDRNAVIASHYSPSTDPRLMEMSLHCMGKEGTPLLITDTKNISIKPGFFSDITRTKPGYCPLAEGAALECMLNQYCSFRVGKFTHTKWKKHKRRLVLALACTTLLAGGLIGSVDSIAGGGGRPPGSPSAAYHSLQSLLNWSHDHEMLPQTISVEGSRVFCDFESLDPSDPCLDTLPVEFHTEKRGAMLRVVQ